LTESRSRAWQPVQLTRTARTAPEGYPDAPGKFVDDIAALSDEVINLDRFNHA
jgi:hypothetical protein